MAGFSHVSLSEMRSYLNLHSSSASSRSFGLRLWMLRWAMNSPVVAPADWCPVQRRPLLPRRLALGARLPRRVRRGGVSAAGAGWPSRSRDPATRGGRGGAQGHPDFRNRACVARVGERQAWRPAPRPAARTAAPVAAAGLGGLWAAAGTACRR